MSFQQDVFNLIQAMTGENNLLATPRLFLQATGDLETGTFLAQLVYWSDKGKRGDGYIYKTMEEWSKEIFMSEYSIRKARKRLEDLGLLETIVKKANGNPTVHYKLLRKPLIDWLLKFRRNETEITQEQNFELKDSITELTAELTSQPTETDKGIFPNGENPILSFSSYCERFEVDEEKRESIEYYLSTYKNKMKRQHPNLKLEQWERVAYSWFDGYFDEHEKSFDLESEDLVLMIDKHFETKYQNCDYNILHFISPGVKARRMYEEAY